MTESYEDAMKDIYSEDALKKIWYMLVLAIIVGVAIAAAGMKWHSAHKGKYMLIGLVVAFAIWQFGGAGAYQEEMKTNGSS
jgi:hypothetical protein